MGLGSHNGWPVYYQLQINSDVMHSSPVCKFASMKWSKQIWTKIMDWQDMTSGYSDWIDVRATHRGVKMLLVAEPAYHYPLPWTLDQALAFPGNEGQLARILPMHLNTSQGLWLCRPLELVSRTSQFDGQLAEGSYKYMSTKLNATEWRDSIYQIVTSIAMQCNALEHKPSPSKDILFRLMLWASGWVHSLLPKLSGECCSDLDGEDGEPKKVTYSDPAEVDFKGRHRVSSKNIYWFGT